MSSLLRYNDNMDEKAYLLNKQKRLAGDDKFYYFPPIQSANRKIKG